MNHTAPQGSILGTDFPVGDINGEACESLLKGILGSFLFPSNSSSSSYSVQGSVFSRIDALLGGLVWEVESTTVTHSSADWWDLLLPLA